MNASPDGLQRRCKDCSKINSKNFRKENPKYYWGKDESYFLVNKIKTKKYNRKYYGIDKFVKIYIIETPDEVYVGTTRRKIEMKKQFHRTNFKSFLEGRPDERNNLYHINAELSKYGLEKGIEYIDNLKIIDYFEGDLESLNTKRKEIIDKLVSEGKTLTNRIYNPKNKNRNLTKKEKN
jgi:hypothetical protein